MKRLRIALGFLTRLPMGRPDASAAEFATAIRCYPLAGLAVGSCVVAAWWLGGLVDHWMAALAGLVAWVAVTGALHLDGLADVADGVGAAHRDRARLLAAMADPHIGSFGAVAVAVQLLAKLVLLHALAPAAWPAVALVPAAARIGPLAWARWLPPMKPGVGALVAGAARQRDLIGWVGLLAIAGLAAPGLWSAPVLFGLVAGWLHLRLGGISGDGHGAGIEVVETGLLLAAVVAGRF